MIYVVENWDITTEVKVAATAKVSDEQNLSFWREGKIAQVYIQEWDNVSKGQVLAELDMEEYDNNILAAELDLANARLWLSKMRNPDISLWQAQLNTQLLEAQLWVWIEQQSSTVLDQQLHNIYLSKNNQVQLAIQELEIAKRSQELLEKQLKDTLWQKKSQLDQVLSDLSIAQKSYDVLLNNGEISFDTQLEQTNNSLAAQEQLLASTVWSIRDSVGDLESVIQRVDLIFWVTNRDTYIYANDLAAKNRWLKRDTKSLVNQSYIVLDSIRSSISQLQIWDDISSIKAVIQWVYNQTDVIITMSDVALDAIDASVSWSDLSLWEIEQLRSIVLGSRNSSISYRAQIQSQISALLNQLSPDIQRLQLDVTQDQQDLERARQLWSMQALENDKELLENDISTFTADLELQLTQSQKQIDTQLIALDLMQKELDGLRLEQDLQRVRQDKQISSQQQQIWLLHKEVQEINKWPNTFDLQQQQNIVSLSEIALNRAKDQKEKFQIIAEFDGRVRTVDITVGEEYSFEDRNFIVIENPDLVELELEVSQIDIVKIAVGDPVSITLDAYPNTPIQATIWSRDLNPINNARWWVNYKATIFLQPQELEIFAGMSGLVTITTDEAKEVIVVPSLAIVQQQGKSYVYKKWWDDYELHLVQTGISNNFLVQIVDGLEIWDKIKRSALSEEALDELGIDESSDSPFGM